MNNQKIYLEGLIAKGFMELCSLEKDILDYNRLTSDEQQDLQTKEDFNYYVNSLHYQILFYLDLASLNNVSEIFVNTFVTGFDISKAFSEIVSDEYQHYNLYIIKIKRFLRAFSFYPLKDYAIGVDQTSLIILERILKNTESIIVNEQKSPNSEAKVYSAVKSVIHAVFPSSKQPQSNFIKTAKTYKPDILIPELKAVVEYKYANSEQTLKTTIEQVYADTQGYTGDPDYEIFYAVFYVTSDFFGLERFKQVWKETKFPPNWKGIYIVGH